MSTEGQPSSESRDGSTREVGPPEPLNAAPLEAGSSIGRYVITGTAGEGGMGVVYRVYDPRLRREVALKRLRPRNAKGGELDATSKARLLAEARAMASLSHPNVLPVYDVEVIDEDLCVTMEYVEGVTLRQWRRHNDPSWYHVVDELIEAGEGLAAAHRAGLVHRDFKPTNAMIGADGRVRVMDFGLATRRSDAESSSMPALISATTATVDEPDEAEPKTEAGVVMGTPAYMAPEQHDGLPADARSDQYAFCVSAFELLYGRRPFAAKGAKALAKAKREGRIRRVPQRSGVPRSVYRILVRGMTVEPALRWPSMDSLLAALRSARTWRRRRPYVIAGGMAAVVGVMYVLGPSAACRGEPQVAEVWNEARAARVESALANTGLPAGSEQWPRLEARLEEYVERWLEQYRSNCEAVGSFERRTDAYLGRQRCLDDRLRSLDAALSVLEEPDAELLPRAHQIISGLRGVEACGPSRRGFAAIAPPGDELATEVQAIERDASRAESLALAGKVRDAMRLQNQLVSRARATGYEPALARVLAGLAKSHGSLGDHKRAVSLGREAFLLALSTGDDVVAIGAALALARSTADGLHRPAEAMHLVEQADALVQRAGLPDRWRGRVEYTRGSVLHSQGRLDAARDALLEALALLDDSESSPDALYRSAAHNNLGLVHRDLGQIREALLQFATARDIHEDVLGPNHPADGAALINLAMARAELGDIEESLADMNRAHQAYVYGYGEHCWPAIMAKGDIAALMVQAGRLEEADAWYQGMQRGLEDLGKTDGIEYTRLQASRARLAAMEGRPDEARQRWAQAMVIVDELEPNRGSSNTELRLEYARFLLTHGEPREARRVLSRLERELVEVVGEHHPLVIESRIALSDALVKMARPEAALDVLEPLHAVAKSAPDLHFAQLAHLRFLLAKTLWERRPAKREEAWQLALAARDGLRRRPDAVPDLVGEVARWLDGHGPKEAADGEEGDVSPVEPARTEAPEAPRERPQ